MTPRQVVNKLQESPATTMGGGILGLGGIVLMFLPSEIRGACMDAITTSENPMVYGGIACLGIILTVIGPGLKLKR